MRVETQHAGSVLVVTVHVQRLDGSVVADFVRAASEATRGAPVVFDLSQVGFVDSSALGALVGLRKGLSPGGVVGVAGAQPAVVTLLKMKRLDAVFRLFPSVADALAALDRP